ncbi:hypothetical protein D3C71_2160650 [compost metagenome]
MQAVLTQRPGQKLNRVTHTGRFTGQVVASDVFVFKGQLDPIGGEHAHRHGEAVHRDFLQGFVFIERR